MSILRLSLYCFWLSVVSAFVTPSNPCPKSLDEYQHYPSLIRPHQNGLFLHTAQDSTSKSHSNAQERLLDAISFNVSAASSIMEDINQLRDPENKSNTSVTDYLNDLLQNGPDLPYWTKSKRLARFSKRARYASLKRTIDRTTPPANENEDDDVGMEKERQQQQQRRRRAFVSILRSLSTLPEKKFSFFRVPSIVTLERKAIRDDTVIILEEDLRNRLPEGLETPKYDILTKSLGSDPAVEIRSYEPYSICAVSMNKPRPSKRQNITDAKLQMPEMAGASSFGALAGYLFGKNEKSLTMKMTTPVFTTPIILQEQKEEDKQMEFVLPSDYWESINTAPKPLKGSGVILQQVKSETRAVLMFGGYASKKEVIKRKEQLKDALIRNEKENVTKDLVVWRPVSDSIETYALAQYNDPFTVPWRRLNEVSVKVVEV